MDKEKTCRLSDPSSSWGESNNVFESIYHHNHAACAKKSLIMVFLESIDPSDVDACIEVRNTCLEVHPRLMSLIPNSDIDRTWLDGCHIFQRN